MDELLEGNLFLIAHPFVSTEYGIPEHVRVFPSIDSLRPEVASLTITTCVPGKSGNATRTKWKWTPPGDLKRFSED